MASIFQSKYSFAFYYKWKHIYSGLDATHSSVRLAVVFEKKEKYFWHTEHRKFGTKFMKNCMRIKVPTKKILLSFLLFSVKVLCSKNVVSQESWNLEEVTNKGVAIKSFKLNTFFLSARHLGERLTWKVPVALSWGAGGGVGDLWTMYLFPPLEHDRCVCAGGGDRRGGGVVASPSSVLEGEGEGDPSKLMPKLRLWGSEAAQTLKLYCLKTWPNLGSGQTAGLHTHIRSSRFKQVTVVATYWPGKKSTGNLSPG